MTTAHPKQPFSAIENATPDATASGDVMDKHTTPDTVMAQAPLKRCNPPICYTLTREKRCPACIQLKPKRKHTRGDPFYSGRKWRRLRRAFLAENPTCLFCAERGLLQAAEDVDHIETRRDRPDREYDWANLRALCHSCHSRRTARDRRG